MVGWVSRSGFMGVVENVRFGDRHLSIVKGFSRGVHFLVFMVVGIDVCRLRGHKVRCRIM